MNHLDSSSQWQYSYNKTQTLPTLENQPPRYMYSSPTDIDTFYAERFPQGTVARTPQQFKELETKLAWELQEGKKMINLMWSWWYLSELAFRHTLKVIRIAENLSEDEEVTPQHIQKHISILWWTSGWWLMSILLSRGFTHQGDAKHLYMWHIPDEYLGTNLRQYYTEVSAAAALPFCLDVSVWWEKMSPREISNILIPKSPLILQRLIKANQQAKLVTNWQIDTSRIIALVKPILQNALNIENINDIACSIPSLNDIESSSWIDLVLTVAASRVHSPIRKHLSKKLYESRMRHPSLNTPLAVAATLQDMAWDYSNHILTGDTTVLDALRLTSNLWWVETIEKWDGQKYDIVDGYKTAKIPLWPDIWEVIFKKQLALSSEDHKLYVSQIKALIEWSWSYQESVESICLFLESKGLSTERLLNCVSKVDITLNDFTKNYNKDLWTLITPDYTFAAPFGTTASLEKNNIPAIKASIWLTLCDDNAHKYLDGRSPKEIYPLKVYLKGLEAWVFVEENQKKLQKTLTQQDTLMWCGFAIADSILKKHGFSLPSKEIRKNITPLYLSKAVHATWISLSHIKTWLHKSFEQNNQNISIEQFAHKNIEFLKNHLSQWNDIIISYAQSSGHNPHIDQKKRKDRTHLWIHYSIVHAYDKESDTFTLINPFFSKHIQYIPAHVLNDQINLYKHTYDQKSTYKQQYPYLKSFDRLMIKMWIVIPWSGLIISKNTH